jgi:hypothetical protein
MKSCSTRQEAAARREREAEALRQNLRRRKEQARAREGEAASYMPANQPIAANTEAET